MKAQVKIISRTPVIDGEREKGRSDEEGLASESFDLDMEGETFIELDGLSQLGVGSLLITIRPKSRLGFISLIPLEKNKILERLVKEKRLIGNRLPKEEVVASSRSLLLLKQASLLKAENSGSYYERHPYMRFSLERHEGALIRDLEGGMRIEIKLNES